MSETRTPELAELVQSAIDFALRDVPVAMPGRIESFDAEKQTASVQPLVKRRDFLDVGGVGQARALPVINGVPVIFPAAGGYRLTFPLAKGDTVLLVWSHRSLDVWQANGGLVDPGDLRHHDVSDAVALVGLHDNGHALADFATDGLVLGKDGGPTVKVTDSAITVDAGSGTVTLKAGTVNVEGTTAINLGGTAAALAVALMGDTAGPYPLVCKGVTIKGKL
jgi:hypothetical protein